MYAQRQSSPQPSTRPSSMPILTFNNAPSLGDPSNPSDPQAQSRPSTGDPSWSMPHSYPFQPTLMATPPTSTWSTYPQSTHPTDAFGPYTPINSGNPVSHSPMVAPWSTPSDVSPSISNRSSMPMRTMPAMSLPRKRASTGDHVHQLLQASPDSRMGWQMQPPTMPYQAYPYATSASMSAIPPNTLSPIPDRRLSSPAGPYAMHPLYAQQAMGNGQRIHPAPPGLDLMYDDSRSENKPARFKPTKEQLAILIASYDQNKNPDAAARDALARQLGSEVRSKTLQIWFQNRRSKSRAKERENAAASQRPLSLGGDGRAGFDPFVQEGSGRKGSLADMESLKAMVHDEDLFLHIVPISVLSMSTWTRFLTPGLTSAPDLCLALRLLCPSPEILLYVSHMTDTYRISIPLVPASHAPTSDDTQGVAAGGSIASIEAAANPTLNAEAVLVRFELSQGTATYACWDAVGGAWVETGDFSGGVVSGGGKVEITGQRETLLPAFAKVHQYLYDAPLLTPVTFTHNQPSPPSPVTPTPTTTGTYYPLGLDSSTASTHGAFTSSWRFPAPTTATSANNTPVHPSAPRNEIAGVRVRAGGMGHAKQRSLSAPIAMPAEFEAARNEIEMDVGMVPEGYGWGALAAPNRWSGMGAVFDSQQQAYQPQKYESSPLKEDAVGEGRAFQYDEVQGTKPANSGYRVAHVNAGNTFQLPSNQLPPRSHNRYPSFSSHMRQRGESEALSLQSNSSSGSFMPRTVIQGNTPPFIFDSMMSAGQDGGYEGEMKAGVSGMNLGGMDMEVLDEM